MSLNHAFSGFQESDQDSIPVPLEFFTELLPHLDDQNELRLILYFFWRIHQIETVFAFISQSELVADEVFVNSLVGDDPVVAINAAIEAALVHQILLTSSYQEESYYFLNDSFGRAAHSAAQRGEWSLVEAGSLPADYLRERKNIFRMYEENIGPLTPMIADMLKEAEGSYPASWIEEGMQIAVKNNKRSWRYIEAILNRWQKEGKDERKNRKNAQEDRHGEAGRDYTDFIER